MNLTWTDPTDSKRHHPYLVKLIEDLAKANPGAKYKVHVSEQWVPTDPIEWSLIISSPKGLQNLSVCQRRPGAAVQFKSMSSAVI